MSSQNYLDDQFSSSNMSYIVDDSYIVNDQSLTSDAEVNKDESCRVKPSDHDLISAVEEFHVLSSESLSKLIIDAQNGIIKRRKKDGSSFKIHVESLARHLGLHVTSRLLSFIPVEPSFTYVLKGIRLLHTLYDIASHNSTLERVLFEDKNVRMEMIKSICSMIIILGHAGQIIDGSSQQVLLYSAVLASGLYLLRAIISTDWRVLTGIILATPDKGHDFTIAAFNAVSVVAKFLKAKLPTQHIDFHMESNVNEVYCLFHLCESSLQFLLSLCMQYLFRESLVKNKKLYSDEVVLKLVRNILQLLECEDPHIRDVIYRLKSQALSVMLLLCEAQSASFLDMTSRTSQSLELAYSTAFEVLEVLKKMFNGDLKNYPRGILQVNAMRLTEIFSSDPGLRTHIILNITEDLTQVFSLPQNEFVSTWCSNDHEPREEEVIVVFDSISASGQVLGLNSPSPVQLSTWSNFQAPGTPYAYQMSSLLVKILANLTCYALDPSEEEDEDEEVVFVDAFLECLQKQFSKLPGGAAERTAAASRNLNSLLAHADSLTPYYLNVDDVDALRWFTDKLKTLLADHESDTQRTMGAYNSRQCQSPTPQISSPSEHDKSGDHNMEPNNTTEAIQVFRGEQSEEQHEKKKKRAKMNKEQIDVAEKALLEQPDMNKGAASLQPLANRLSLHGPVVTPAQLKNWINNRKAKLARAAAKEARVHSVRDEAMTENQTESDPDPISDLPESSKTTQDTVVVPANRFKFQVGQKVMLRDAQGEKIGEGIIYQTRGSWFEWDLQKLRLCVVDVKDINVPVETELPYPTPAGSTFYMAKLILTYMRIVWASSKLSLIN